jgi:hypothetical protein
MSHIVKKISTKTTTFLQTSSQSEVYMESYGLPKLWESQLWEFRDFQLGILGQNDIWALVSWPNTKYVIRGKVVPSLKFRPWWVLWVRVCPWLNCATKCSNYALINLLFGLCRFVWVIKLLLKLRSPILEFQHTSLPSKCCEPKSAPQLPFLLLFSPLDS